MAKHSYLLALGSNVRHSRYGAPRAVLAAAIAALTRASLAVERRSTIIRTAPLGPSRRDFANGAVLVSCGLNPPELLERLKRIERDFGRKRAGLAWRARVLDIDIVLWSGGMWASPGLVIPHAGFRERRFVLEPAVEIVPDWRDPVTGLSLRQLLARLTKPRPVPR